jgi:hypothetical protein
MFDPLAPPPPAVKANWERIPRKHSRMEPLDWSAAFTPLLGSKALRPRMLKRRKRRAPDVRFMGEGGGLEGGEGHKTTPRLTTT